MRLGVIGVVLCGFLGLGCDRPSAAPNVPSALNAVPLLQSPDGRITVRIETAAWPYPVNRHFSLKASIEDRRPPGERHPLSLVVDADMPAHKHGMNVRPEISRVGADLFEVRGMLLHMPGDWEIYFTLSDESGYTERIVQTITLK